jgi:starch phosphorylase
LWPARFNNKSNGVSLRRFVRLANPRLSELIGSAIGGDWLRDAARLARLEPMADDAQFRRAWREIKHQNKVDLATYVRRAQGLDIDPASLFDIMAKRLHEYKRQLLKVLHIVALYDRIKRGAGATLVPRTCLFAAKAAPGYQRAKLIIKLINAVAQVVNRDPEAAGRLAVVFLPDFNVSMGERLYPAADVSEQISLAGKEAAGTGNMKFALNGALTTGTLDGANVEIRAEVGAENFFAFGLTVEEVFALQARGYDPKAYCEANPELARVMARLASGEFADGDRSLFRAIVETLLGDDPYLHLADFDSYVRCQDDVEIAYRDVERWTRQSILNVARCGFFSSDRAVLEYNEDIWHAPPLAAGVYSSDGRS